MDPDDELLQQVMTTGAKKRVFFHIPSPPKAAEAKAAEAKAADANAADAKAADAKPADAKPADAKPAEAKADAKPRTWGKFAYDAFGALKPKTAKPAEAKPVPVPPVAEAKPAEAKPAEAKPAEAKPAEAKPAAEEKQVPPVAEEKPAVPAPPVAEEKPAFPAPAPLKSAMKKAVKSPTKVALLKITPPKRLVSPNASSKIAKLVAELERKRNELKQREAERQTVHELRKELEAVNQQLHQVEASIDGKSITTRTVPPRREPPAAPWTPVHSVVNLFVGTYVRMLSTFWRFTERDAVHVFARRFINELLPRVDEFVQTMRGFGLQDATNSVLVESSRPYENMRDARAALASLEAAVVALPTFPVDARRAGEWAAAASVLAGHIRKLR